MNPADYYYTYGEKMPIEPSMIETVVSLIERLGVSIAVVFASFYYILFLTKQAKEERQAFWKKDAENDEKLFWIWFFIKNLTACLFKSNIFLQPASEPPSTESSRYCMAAIRALKAILFMKKKQNLEVTKIDEIFNEILKK